VPLACSAPASRLLSARMRRREENAAEPLAGHARGGARLGSRERRSSPWSTRALGVSGGSSASAPSSCGSRNAARHRGGRQDSEAAGAGRRGWPAMRARVAGDVGRGRPVQGGFFFFLYLGGGLRRTFMW
jgi:hypothetical protein